MLRHLLLVTFALALSLLPGRSIGQTPTDEALPRDPGNVYGEFNNGMKYIVRKNATPPDKVTIYVHIRSGSFNESDQQRGIAHFIEHMAFNGSKHYPPGKLLPLLNSMGMSFGGDTNAHTSLRETVYKLTLPNAKPETIETGLTVMSDYLDGLLFEPAQVDSERTVILEEARSRKSVAQRMRKAMNQAIWGDTRLATREPIGEEEQIKKFQQTDFMDYWNAWYRPELMTLVAVGDIGPQAFIEAARAKLGTFKARAPERSPEKAGVRPFEKPRALVLSDPEQVAGQVQMLCARPGRAPITTKAQYRQDVLEGVSEWIVNRRFSDIVTKGGAPFRGASVDSGDMFHEVQQVAAGAAGEAQDWNNMLDATIAEVSRAIDHGFTQHELDLAKKETLAGAERGVKTEGSRDSKNIVTAITGAVGQERPMLSAQQRLDLLKEILATITTDQLHQAFVGNFKTSNWAYILMLPSSKDGLKLPSEEDVLAAARAAWAKKTTAPEEVKLAGSILASEPDAGKALSKEVEKELGITTVTFANGVVMHHKFTDYKKDSASVQITMPGGAIEETSDNRGISEVAGLMLYRPATSRFTSSQIRDVLAGKNVSVGGGIGLDTLSIGVSGSPADLPLGMQLAYAIITDGKLEQSALDDWKKNELQGLELRKTSAQAQIGDAMVATVYAGDVRFKPLTAEIINRQERSPAEAWFKRIAGQAAIEVAIVGDIDLKDATDLVAKYVGSLPKRQGRFGALDPLRKLDRGAGPYTQSVSFKSVTPKAAVLSGYISCDARDPERRPLSLASIILSDRMVKQIREAEQLVYSIGCQNQPGRSIPGTGLIMASAPTDPQNAQKLADRVSEMLEDFANKGPTDDEMKMARKQIANRLASQMKEPSFWMTQLEDMVYRGRSMEDIKALPGIFETFSAEQVRDAVKKYVKDERKVQLLAIPESKSASKPATMAAE